MPDIEPTYLRCVVDGLKKGSLNPNNNASLPHGLTEVFEQEFPQNTPSIMRMYEIKILSVWALLKRPVSLSFVSHVFGLEEEEIGALVVKYSKWFTLTESGKYQLYHERLKVYLLSKLSDSELIILTSRLIEYLKSDRQNFELMSYRSHHYSDHLVITCYHNSYYIGTLNDVVYDDEFWDESFHNLKSTQPAIENVQNLIAYSVCKENWDMLRRCTEIILDLEQKTELLCEKLLTQPAMNVEEIEFCFGSISSQFEKLRFLSQITLRISEKHNRNPEDIQWLSTLWSQLVNYVQSDNVSVAHFLPHWSKKKLEEFAHLLKIEGLKLILKELEFDDLKSIEEREYDFIYLTDDVEEYSEHDRKTFSDIIFALNKKNSDFLKVFRIIDTPNLMDRDELICRATVTCVEDDYQGYFDWLYWLVIHSDFEWGEHAPPNEKFFSKNLIGKYIQRSNLDYLKKVEKLVFDANLHQDHKMEVRCWISDQYYILGDKESAKKVLNRFTNSIESTFDTSAWKSAWYSANNIAIDVNELSPSYRLESILAFPQGKLVINFEKVDELLRDLDNDKISKAEYFAETAVKVYSFQFDLATLLLNNAWDLVDKTSDWASIFAKTEVLAASLNFMDTAWIEHKLQLFEKEYKLAIQKNDFIITALQSFYYYYPYRFSDKNMLQLVLQLEPLVCFLKKVDRSGLQKAIENEKSEYFITYTANEAKSFREFWRATKPYFSSESVGCYIDDFWKLFENNSRVFYSITAEDVRIIAVISRKVNQYFPLELHIEKSSKLDQYQERIPVPDDWQYGSKKGFLAMLSKKTVDKNIVGHAILSGPRTNDELTKISIKALGFMLTNLSNSKNLVKGIQDFLELRTEIIQKYG